MDKKSPEILEIYYKLYSEYGPQGWWPVLDYKNKETGTSLKYYHPEDYDIPNNDKDRFEICLGAILTQNTSWKNVEKAMMNLKSMDFLEPEKIIAITDLELAEAIKSAGYFNQKTRKIKEFAKFYISLKGKTPSRENLLNVWGIGRETADSILLYAYKFPIFVVDAYTRRLFSHLKLCNEKEDYDKIRELFENNLPRDFTNYQEYHALIVEHGKKHYSKKPYAKDCFLVNRRSS